MSLVKNLECKDQIEKLFVKIQPKVVINCISLNKESQSFEISKKIMEVNNPRIIPRNHIVGNVLESAEKGDLNPFKEYIEILKDPYSNDNSVLEYYTKPPKESEKVLQTFCGT